MDYISGKHPVIEALKTGQPIDRIIAIPSAKKQLFDTPDIRSHIKSGIKIQTMAPDIFRRQFGHLGNTQGIVAQVSSKAYLSIQRLITHIQNYPIVVILDHLQDPHNVGAVLRSCEQFGVKAVVLAKDRQVPLNATVNKAASGALNYIDVVKVTNLSQSIRQLKEAGYWIYGTDVHSGDPLPHIQPTFPCAIIVGSEGKGVSQQLAKMVDFKVIIPTVGQLDSLNVSVATGIILYHFSTQYAVN